MLSVLWYKVSFLFIFFFIFSNLSIVGTVTPYRDTKCTRDTDIKTLFQENEILLTQKEIQ